MSEDEKKGLPLTVWSVYQGVDWLLRLFLYLCQHLHYPLERVFDIVTPVTDRMMLYLNKDAYYPILESTMTAPGLLHLAVLQVIPLI